MNQTRVARLWAALLGLLVFAFPVVGAPPAQAYPLSTPAAPQVYASSSTALAVSWRAVSGAPRYRVAIATDAAMTKVRYLRTTSTWLEIGSLTPSTTYYLKVRAIDQDGGNLSSYSSATKTATRSSSSYPFLPPSGLTASAASGTTVPLAWTPRDRAPRYRVQIASNSSFSNPRYVRVTDPNLTVTDLRPATSYWFRVRVITADGANLSQYGPAIKATTTSTTTPGSGVTGLTVTPGPTSLKAAWKATTGVSRYQLTWSTSSTFTDAASASTSSTSLTTSALPSGTTYYLKVRGVDAGGNGVTAYSAVVSATTTWAYPAPDGLASRGASGQAVALAWTASGGATDFRVQYATNSSMSGAAYVRFSGTSGTVTGLDANTAYWFKVRVITADGLNRSPYGPAISVTTKSASFVQLAPTDLVATATAATTIKATWRPPAAGLRYEVRATASGLTPLQTPVSTTTATLSGLQPATRYTVAVRVVDASGNALSDYSAAVQVTTGVRSAPLRIASFNVKCANCFSGLLYERTWYERRDTLVAQVKRQAPDVIGFQEASQAWLKDPATGQTINLSQFEDLAKRLGGPYKLTNANRNNCEKSTTPTNCVYKDQGASKGTKIIYNSDELTLERQGSVKLPYLSTSDNERYVAWAVFLQKDSGKRFFFADTHLEPEPDTSGSTAYYDLRARQTDVVIQTIRKQNPDGLPTVIVGDLNSHKYTSPSNAPYDHLVAAGYVDPLGNTYRSTVPASTATVENRIKTNCSSFNGYALRPPCSTNANGTYIDYLFTSPGVRFAEWETVVDVDPATGLFAGIIPSDHNMLRGTVYLP